MSPPTGGSGSPISTAMFSAPSAICLWAARSADASVIGRFLFLRLVGNAERAFYAAADRAGRAADDGADRAADRSRRPVALARAFVRAFLRAADDALRTGGNRNRQKRANGNSQPSNFHGSLPR